MVQLSGWSLTTGQGGPGGPGGQGGQGGLVGLVCQCASGGLGGPGGHLVNVVSLDDAHSENVWFSWSKPTDY